MAMKMNEREICGTVENTRQWMLVLQAVTGGGTPKKETRADWQHFRWAMMQNLQRIQEAWKVLSEKVSIERERILMKHCKDKERFNTYTAETKRAFGPFSKYLLPTGGYNLPKGDIKRRFNEVHKKLAEKYKDIDAAGNEFSKRQAEMFAEKICVKLICCDYSEVPDDVNCAYLDFLKEILLGLPSLRFFHALICKKQRFEPAYAAELTAKITGAIAAGRTGKTPSTDAMIALEVMKVLFAEAAVPE